MHQEDDRAYFFRRAAEERQRASVTEDNQAALAHLKLADEYERKAAAMPAVHTPQPVS